MALLAKSPLTVMMSRTRWSEEHFAGQSFDVPSPDSRRARIQIEIAAPERCNLAYRRLENGLIVAWLYRSGPG